MIWKSDGVHIYIKISNTLIEDLKQYQSPDIFIEANNTLYIHKSNLYSVPSAVSNSVELPDIFPFDVVVDKDARNGLTILRTYNKYNDGNGSIIECSIDGCIINVTQDERQYLLPEDILSSISKVKEAIHLLNTATTITERYKPLYILQAISQSNSLLLHGSLNHESIEIPEEVKIDIHEDPNDETRIQFDPYIESATIGKVKISLSKPIRSRAISGSKGKKTRIVLTKNIQEDLKKLKKTPTVRIDSQDNDNALIADPSRFLDVSTIDFSKFSARVIEIGKYNPQYYSFLIPGKRGKWIPNIQLKNYTSGQRTNIKVETLDELENLKENVEKGKIEGSKEIQWGDTSIPLNVAEKLIPKFEKAFTTSEQINRGERVVKTESDTMVLVIHENATDLEYSEADDASIPLSEEDENFIFHQVQSISSAIQLRDHQIRGVAQIQYLINNKNQYKGVLLADDMGLGKTLQVLYLIEHYASTGSLKPCIIVAPVSLLKNWENEYEKFFPNRSYLTKKIRGRDIPREENYIDEETVETLRHKQLILTNYETYRDAQLTFAQIDFGIIAIDEAQRIKTPGTMITSAIKATKADFKIAMTGTPVENTMVDLWSIVDFIQPGLFFSAKSFHGTYQVPMQNPEVNHESLVTELRSRMGLQFIRRLKKDVAKDLPTKHEHRVECPLTEIQMSHYQNLIYDFEASESNNPLPFIHKLKLLCDCPLLINSDLPSLSADELIQSTARLQKLKTILSDIKRDNEKVILFAEYRRTQEMLKKVVKEWFQYNPYIINGSTSTEDTKNQLSRQSYIDKYQNQEGFGIIIMSPIAAGVGLNVTAANHVIHYSRHWNPAKESQATDRAYRIGQTKDVHVYYLISTHEDFDTFDILLDKLLRKKAILSEDSMYPSVVIEVAEQDFASAFTFKGKSGKGTFGTFTLEDVLKFNPLKFESAIAALYESTGKYKAFITPTSNDYGADVVCFSEDQNLLIQVKKSKNPINNQGAKDVLAAKEVYSKKYNCEFELLLVSNANLSKNAQRVVNDSQVQYFNISTLFEELGVESISYALFNKIEQNRIKEI